jgi:hypothetical protein
MPSSLEFPVPGEGRFSSYTASSSTFGAGMFLWVRVIKPRQNTDGKVKRKEAQGPSLLLPDSYTSPRPMGSTHSLSRLPTLSMSMPWHVWRTVGRRQMAALCRTTKTAPSSVRQGRLVLRICQGLLNRHMASLNDYLNDTSMFMMSQSC